MVQITAKAGHIGFIASILKDTVTFYPLYKRMAEAAGNVAPNDLELPLTVDVHPAELISVMIELSNAREGIAAAVNAELKASIGMQIAAGLQLTGPDLAEWQSIAAGLQNILTGNEATVNQMISEGWQYLTA